MDKTTETWITVPKRPVSTSNRQACLVHIYPTGAGMGSRYMLGDTPVVLDRELARSARHHRPLSLVMVDIDRFKSVNDELGHLAGDFTLRELVSLVKEAIRKEELFARYGGEEFVVVLPETTREGAQQMAERLRQLVENHPFQYEERRYNITVSLGLVSTEGDESLTPNDLIKQADENLYQAKHDGRNRVGA